MSADLAPITTNSPVASAVPLGTPDQVDLLKRTIAPDLTDDELALFGAVCQRRGADPFLGQIYAVKRKGRMVIQTGIDWFRSKAEETGRYAGQVGPWWCGPDGQWREVWLEQGAPSAARIGILRSDFREPLYAVAHYSEYVQLDSNGQVVAMWRKMPSNQLAKCSEALAFRKAFPAQLGGVYTDVEMAQADNPPPAVEVVEVELTERQRQAKDAVGALDEGLLGQVGGWWRESGLPLKYGQLDDGQCDQILTHIATVDQVPF